MYYENGQYQGPGGHATSWVDLGGGIGAYVHEGSNPMQNLPTWDQNDPRMGGGASGDLVGALGNTATLGDYNQPTFESPFKDLPGGHRGSMSGSGFDSSYDTPVNGSNSRPMDFWAMDEGGQQGVFNAATYNPLSGFQNIVEAESILPWLYAEDEEGDRRIRRNYLDELFGDQPAPFHKQLPTANVYGGFAGMSPSGGNVYETTGGGGDWYDSSFINTTPTSDLWSLV